MYIGGTVGCEKNSQYLAKQAPTFLAGKTPPDFAPDNFEVDFVRTWHGEGFDGVGEEAVGFGRNDL